jgi:hypothetical protein
LQLLARLAALFSEKSAEDRIHEAASVVDAATWAYLWLEYQAVAKAFDCAQKIEDAIDRAHLEDVDDGVEIGHQYLAFWVAELRRKLDRLLRGNQLLYCKSTKEIDNRKSDLWRIIETELGLTAESALSYIARYIETGQSATLFQPLATNTAFLFPGGSSNQKIYTARDRERKQVQVKKYRRGQ